MRRALVMLFLAACTGARPVGGNGDEHLLQFTMPCYEPIPARRPFDLEVALTLSDGSTSCTDLGGYGTACASGVSANLSPISEQCDNGDCDITVKPQSVAYRVELEVNVRNATVFHIAVQDQDGARWTDETPLTPGSTSVTCSR